VVGKCKREHIRCMAAGSAGWRHITCFVRVCGVVHKQHSAVADGRYGHSREPQNKGPDCSLNSNASLQA
jgi:hypothetical protein